MRGCPCRNDNDNRYRATVGTSTANPSDKGCMCVCGWLGGWVSGPWLSHEYPPPHVVSRGEESKANDEIRHAAETRRASSSCFRSVRPERRPVIGPTHWVGVSPHVCVSLTIVRHESGFARLACLEDTEIRPVQFLLCDDTVGR
jgi:hypothetical protein